MEGFSNTTILLLTSLRPSRAQDVRWERGGSMGGGGGEERFPFSPAAPERAQKKKKGGEGGAVSAFDSPSEEKKEESRRKEEGFVLFFSPPRKERGKERKKDRRSFLHPWKKFGGERRGKRKEGGGEGVSILCGAGPSNGSVREGGEGRGGKMKNSILANAATSKDWRRSA